MEDLVNWIAMGGYSIYVWPAYGVAASTLLGSFLMMKVHKKRIKKQLQNWFNG